MKTVTFDSVKQPFRGLDLHRDAGSTLGAQAAGNVRLDLGRVEASPAKSPEGIDGSDTIMGLYFHQAIGGGAVRLASSTKLYVDGVAAVDASDHTQDFVF